MEPKDIQEKHKEGTTKTGEENQGKKTIRLKANVIQTTYEQYQKEQQRK